MMRDPFQVVGKVPAGKVYQWVATSVCGEIWPVVEQWEQMLSENWRPVPAKRHPRMRHRRGVIAVNNCVLMERTKA